MIEQMDNWEFDNRLNSLGRAVLSLGVLFVAVAVIVGLLMPQDAETPPQKREPVTQQDADTLEDADYFDTYASPLDLLD